MQIKKVFFFSSIKVIGLQTLSFTNSKLTIENRYGESLSWPYETLEGIRELCLWELQCQGTVRKKAWKSGNFWRKIQLQIEQVKKLLTFLFLFHG